MTQLDSEGQAAFSAVEETATLLAGITGTLVAGPEPGSTISGMITTACMRLLHVDAVGIMLTDPRGGTEVIFASEEEARFIELLQSQTQEGPCIDCIATGSVIRAADLTGEQRWPTFAPAAVRAGFRAVHAVPMHLDRHSVGGLNLLHRAPRRLSAFEEDLGQALADLTVLAFSQELDPGRRSQRLTEQTLSALNDRVMLGQAVGMIAGTLGIPVDEARTALHRYVEQRRLSLRETAWAITAGTLDPAELSAEHPGVS